MTGFLNLSSKKLKKIHKIFSIFVSFSLVLQLFSGVFLYKPAFAEEEDQPETQNEEPVAPAEENTEEAEEESVETVEENEENSESIIEDNSIDEENSVVEAMPEVSPTATPTLTPDEEVVSTPTTEEEIIPAEDSAPPQETGPPLDLEEQVEDPESGQLVEEPVIEKTCLIDGQEIKDSTNEDWEINLEEDWAQTKEPVKLGVKYLFPQENKVSVTFKCLPQEGTTPLKIQKVKISDLNLPEGTNPYGEYAYDITTGMQDGTFEYDVTLPKPDNKAAEVSFMEDPNGEVKTVEEGKISQEGDKVKVESLDHFTIFYTVESYSDDAYITVEDDFYQGETVYAKATRTSAANMRLRYLNPSNQVVQTCAYSNSTVVYCDYDLPSDAPFGEWTIQIGRCYYNCESINNWFWGGYNSEDNFNVLLACNNSAFYEKSGDFSNSEVTIDFSSDKKSITVSAGIGYTITNVWLDVDEDGQREYVWYPTPITNFDPPGKKINKAKVEVMRVCSVCGNSQIESGEVCDGDFQSCTTGNGYSGTQSCNSSCDGWEDCQSSEYCGDGNINGPEECDYGEDNGKLCTPPYEGSCDYCSTSCKITTCGDGIVDEDETCDDGPDNGKYDHCNPWCYGRAAFCGDGNVDTDYEQCDDGNDSSGDGCDNSCQIESGYTCSGEPSDCQITNPSLSQSCGLDMVLVIDTSTSIDNTELALMKTAFINFVNAFIGTPTEIAIVSFDDEAILRSGFTSNLPSLTSVIDGIDGDGYTNWEDALLDSRLLFPNRGEPDLIVFTSDGNPTDSSAGGPNIFQPNEHLAPAITQANLAKAAGIRIVTLGIGNDVSQSRLEAISSADAYYNVANFGALADILYQLATELCGGTITVTKYVDGQPAADWEFSVDVINEDPDPSSGTTDGSGMINFDINPSDGSANVDVIETLQGGHSLVTATCEKATVPVGTFDNVDSVDGIVIGNNDIVSCVFENTAQYCGDGGIYGEEECDDGAQNGQVCTPSYGGTCDYCSNDCQTVTVTGPYCGDSNLDLPYEDCDNDPPQACQAQDGYNGLQTCSSCQWGECQPTEYCGDGQINGSEECDDDDGVTEGENFCTANCTLVPIYDGQHSCPEGTVKSQNPIWSGVILATDPDGENLNLPTGMKLLFEASGTFVPTSAAGYLADAGYTLLNGVLVPQYGIHGSGSDYAAHALLSDFGTGIVGVVDWGDCNPDHVYNKYYEPNSDWTHFVIGDRYSDWFNTSWQNQAGMSDNSGSLDLDIYECQETGSITIIKDRIPDYPEQFTFEGNLGTFDLTDDGSALRQKVFTDVPEGNYTVTETQANGLVLTSIGCTGDVDGGSLYDLPGKSVEIDLDADEDIICTFTNEEPVKIKAAKVICEDEADLPNWGNHGSTIGVNTAQDYVDSHPGCSLEEQWQFQWAGAGAGSFGAFQTDTSVLGAPWNTFAAGETVKISDLSVLGGRIELREIISDAVDPMIGFSNDDNNDFSAEFYCTGDVYHYDNWEWVNNPQYGQIYYCVAFNAPDYGSVSGMKYEDMNGNGSNDGDSGLLGWLIELRDSESQLIDSTTTDGSGNYSFQDVLFGDYYVCEVEQSDWMRTQPGESNCQAVTVNPGEETSSVDFGNYMLGQITVCKYDDYNGDGLLDDGEPGIMDVTMTLEKKMKEDEDGFEWVVLGMGDTGEEGCYTFGKLEIGDYRVTEDLNDLPGYRPSDGTEGSVETLIDSSGQPVSVNFFNELKPITLGLHKTHDKIDKTASPGNLLNFTLTLTNSSDSTAYGVVVRDTLPDGFSYNTGTAQVDGIDSEPTISGQQLIWNLGDIEAAGERVITYQATIGSGLPNGSYPNVSVASGTNRASDPDNETSYSNFAFVYTAVGVGVSYTTSIGGFGTVAGASIGPGGEVLGAATGSPTILLIIALLMVILGLMLRFYGKTRKFFLRLLKLLPIFIIALFAFANLTFAQTLMIKSVDMPDYINYDPFEISYTAVDASGDSITVTGYLKKEGNSYQEIGTSTNLSDTFTIDGGILSGDGLYKIYFKAVSSSETDNSDEESFTIDRQAPGPVSDYKKERKDTFVYKICWKNPDEDDFDRVVVYRSDEQEFQADGSTQVAEVGGTKNEEKCYEDGIPESKDYYYVLRVVDHAGNISGVIGDIPASSTEVLGDETAGATGAVEGDQVVLPEVGDKSVDGQEGADGGTGDGELGGGESVAGVADGEGFRLSTWQIVGIIIVGGGLIILVIYFFLKKKE